MTSPANPATAFSELNVGDIEGFDADQVAGAFERVKIARGFIDHYEAVLTSHAARLHTNGAGAPAADVHTTCGGVSAAEGKRRERRSKTIEHAPSFGEALATGSIGAEHVDALANATSKLGDDVKGALLAAEDELIDEAQSMSPERFGRSCRDRARRLEKDHGLERNRRQRRDTFMSRKLNLATGMIEGRFSLHPELGSQIFGAIDREVAATIAAGERRGDTDFVERRYDRNRLAAEALGTLVAGGHQQIRPAEADITLVVDATTAAGGELHEHSICETSNGAELPPASVARLLCEGRVTPVIVGANGTVLDAGRTIRHANRAQRRALRAMYRSCAFGDCDMTFDRCEIHHVMPWEVGGPTDLVNLLPLCSRHHHVVHEGGWRLDVDDDRSLTITQPDGRVFQRCRPELTDRRTRRRTAA